LADGHVLTSLGVYNMQYYQLQESVFNPQQVAAASNDINIPYSSINGIEGSVQAKVAHFGLDLSADYKRSKLGSATTARTYAFPQTYGHTNQCAPGVTPNATNTNCTDYTPFVVTLSGESLPFSPLFQGAATLKYDIPLNDDMSLEPRVSYTYTGKEYAALFQIPYYEMPAHGLVNAYLDWTAGPWTTEAFVTNLSDQLYVTNLTTNNEYFGNPRQYGLRFTRTF